MRITRLEGKDGVALADAILTSDGIWDGIHDDRAPEARNFTFAPMIESKDAYAMMMNDALGPIGLCLFTPMTSAMCQVHVAVLPKARGKRAALGFREAAKWAGRHLPYAVVLGFTHDRKANIVANAFGMRRAATIPHSFLLGGKYLDQTLWVYVNREEN